MVHAHKDASPPQDSPSARRGRDTAYTASAGASSNATGDMSKTRSEEENSLSGDRGGGLVVIRLAGMGMGSEGIRNPGCCRKGVWREGGGALMASMVGWINALR